MAYILKSSGLATRCTMCVAADPDTGVVTEFANSQVNGAMTAGNVAVAQGVWNAINRKYFHLPDKTSLLQFGVNKPAYVQNSASPSLSFFAALEYRTAGEIGAIVSSGAAKNHFNGAYNSGGKIPTWIRDGVQYSGSTYPANQDMCAMGYASTQGGSLKGYLQRNYGPTVVSPNATLSSQDGDITTTVASIGLRVGGIATQHRYYLVALFDKELSQADFEALAADPFGVLLEPFDPNAEPPADGPLGRITTPPLKNNAGTLLAHEHGVVVNVYDPATGVLVLHKTGLSSDGAGVVQFTDPALAVGVIYAYEVVLTGGRRRLPLVTAS